MSLLSYSTLLLLLISLMSLSLYWKHALSALILIEFLALSVFMFGVISAKNMTATFLISYLTILVCSSVMSLSIMLSYSRQEGTDLFSVNAF